MGHYNRLLTEMPKGDITIQIITDCLAAWHSLVNLEV